MDIIVGTAGHIDHGKTALVKALTGIDADRLPEEKQRGITIDLGFAELDSCGVKIGFVDVPGHERFVKNMLAGASGIDLVLLVIAADEGVMPQTREHFDICRLLRIKTGVVVLTKADLADADTLELARLDAAELVKGSFLEDAPVFEVSSTTGNGIDLLKEGLVAAARNVNRERDVFETRLPIDRSFSVKGFGAVVTGTLSAGEIAEGEELELVPAGRNVRVRGVQTHGKSVKTARGGQRTAVNLAGVDHAEIMRGLVLSKPAALTTTLAFDAEIEMLKTADRGLRSRQRVRLHLGTSEVLARVAILNDAKNIDPGSSGFAQFRLESPVAAAHGDRFIIRSYSPQHTIGGGRILDPSAHRHRKKDLALTTDSLTELSRAADGDGNPVSIFVRMAGRHGMRLDELRSRTALRKDVIKHLVDTETSTGDIADAGGILVTRSVFEDLEAETLAAIELHHRDEKLSRGIPRETLRERIFKGCEPELFRSVTSALERAGKIAFDQDVFKLAVHRTELSPAEAQVRENLRRIYSKAGLEVPKLDDALLVAATGTTLDQRSARKVFQLMVNEGELVSVSNDFYVPTTLLGELTAKLREVAQASGDPVIDVAKFKEIAGVSRKYAIPLLEYFDRTRVTRRVGDKRQIL